MKIQNVLVVGRDAGMIVVGLGGIIFQQVTGRVNIELLLTYTALLGVPGAIQVLQRLFRGATPTTGSSPPSLPPSSSPDSH